jgi:hypothetical protein
MALVVCAGLYAVAALRAIRGIGRVLVPARRIKSLLA